MIMYQGVTSGHIHIKRNPKDVRTNVTNVFVNAVL